MGIEYELKFKATAAQQELVRQMFDVPEQHFSMATTYYDTPSGALSARQYTLRRRMENDCSVCTLKAPAELGRGEWELPCEDIWEAIPKLCKLGAPADLETLVKEGLMEVCGARFSRIAKTITLPEATAELALDSGVLIGGGRELPLREIEVELKDGKPEAVAAFGAQLALGVGLEAEKHSKFRRALALYRGE